MKIWLNKWKLAQMNKNLVKLLKIGLNEWKFG